MYKEELISAEEFCIHHKIEVAFIRSLQEYGLIEIVTIEEVSYIQDQQLEELEKLTRLHYELGINMEGLEAIVHLLSRIDNMQSEIVALKNRLSRYE